MTSGGGKVSPPKSRMTKDDDSNPHEARAAKRRHVNYGNQKRVRVGGEQVRRRRRL